MTANGPVQPGDLFFFYGLLKQGAAGMPDHIDFEANGAFLSPAFIRGDLYRVAYYPGVVEGRGLTQGLLYRLDDISILPLLDEFEDVDHARPDRSLYHRVRRPVLDADGAPTGELAWVYWYVRSVDGCENIADGNWPLDGL
ncbi:MAG: hypothetical protein CMK09_04225 [Ponticaulis sp.]|nr:hypothetical protein [Ponticaulis sp.]|tara:strand:- start:10269 stop:10691 length:423 start_codon:yes stop_codon:yes gene_type:complete